MIKTILKLGFILWLFQFNIVFALDITAQSWLVANHEGTVISSENPNAVRSIASITKLLTVIAVLDSKQPLNDRVNQYTRKELIQLALIKSDNEAAQLLCDKYPGGTKECIIAINSKISQLGLINTKIIEPTGLSVFNVSTAMELIKIVQLASTYPEIVEASKTSQIKIKIRKKWFIFNNTNPSIGKTHQFIVSKTGFIKASGGCIVMMLNTDVGRRIVVVLGSKNTHTRIPEAEFIADYL